MKDFTCGNISGANVKVLRKLDSIIDLYQSQGNGVNKITLTALAYENLNKNLMSKTEGRESLKTHSYHGYELVTEK